jgi:hypothetical protein
MGDTKLAKVADFLETMPTTCPHDLSAARMAPATPSSRPIFSPSTGSWWWKSKTPRRKWPPSFCQPSAPIFSAIRSFSASCSRTTLRQSPSRCRFGPPRRTLAQSRPNSAASLFAKEPFDPSDPSGPHKPRHSPATSIFFRSGIARCTILDDKPDARTNKPMHFRSGVDASQILSDGRNRGGFRPMSGWNHQARSSG